MSEDACQSSAPAVDSESGRQNPSTGELPFVQVARAGIVIQDPQGESDSLPCGSSERPGTLSPRQKGEDHRSLVVATNIEPNATEIANFWVKVDKHGPVPQRYPELGPCWVWTASLANKGYGAFGWRGKTFKAHRFSWLLVGREIPDGLCLLHRCDNPPCVNPDHFFLGTKADNNADMTAKGRHVSGSSKTPVSECRYKKGMEHHNAKLTADQVREIRRSYAAGGVSYPMLARQFNCSATAILKIVRRVHWSHVD